MAIVAMDEVLNTNGKDGPNGKYNDGLGCSKFIKDLTSIAVGNSDVVMTPNQVKGLAYTLDVETGSATATVYVTGSPRSVIESGIANAVWEASPAGATALNRQGTTKTITAIYCVVSVGTARLTVTDGAQRNN